MSVSSSGYVKPIEQPEVEATVIEKKPEKKAYETTEIEVGTTELFAGNGKEVKK